MLDKVMWPVSDVNRTCFPLLPKRIFFLKTHNVMFDVRVTVRP